MNPQNSILFPEMRGNKMLNKKLEMMDMVRDKIPIHKNDQGGLPVKTSQKAMVNAVRSP